jgi:hypothetical protein
MRLAASIKSAKYLPIVTHAPEEWWARVSDIVASMTWKTAAVGV